MKTVNLVLLIVGVIALGVLGLYLANVCPPAGPWPKPPWCAEWAALPSPSSPNIAFPSLAAVSTPMPSVSNPTLPSPVKPQAPSPTASPVPKYEYKDLDYLAGQFNKTARKLVFGVGLMDLWGFHYAKKGVGFPNPANNTEYAASTMERLRSIGSQLAMITDFAVLNKNLSMGMQTNQYSGAHEMSQSDLLTIVAEAKRNGQKTMMITNLYDGEDGARRAVKWENPSDEEINRLFANWQGVIAGQAEKAENAKVDYLIINPRDISFNFGPKDEAASKKWYGILKSVREKFNGKVCLWHASWFFTDRKFTADGFDCIVIDDSPWSFLGDTQKELGAIEQKWAGHFADYQKAVDVTGGNKETFLLIMMPSYSGAMKTGWIEPVAEYPEGKYAADWKEQALVYEGFFRAVYANKPSVTGVISYGYWWNDAMYPDVWPRNDLSHSIRGKDAENVFRKWSLVFNN